jgi:hypothetical protein
MLYAGTVVATVEVGTIKPLIVAGVVDALKRAKVVVVPPFESVR